MKPKIKALLFVVSIWPSIYAFLTCDLLEHSNNSFLRGGKSLNACKKTTRNGILLPKLFLPTVRKRCSIDWEKHLKFEVEGKFLRSLEQFIQTVKGQNNLGNRMLF